MEGDDGTLTRDIDESKEPSSDRGAEGSVRDGIDKPVDARVAAPIDGAGGITTDDAARESLASSEKCSGSATTMLGSGG